MTSNPAPKAKRRPTTMVPVTTLEEIPVLSEMERADLSKSLKEAEQRIKAGKGLDFEPTKFRKRLLGIYRERKR